MKKLIDELQKFYALRSDIKLNSKNWDWQAVAECFAPIAEYVLLKGYFLINNYYIIDIGSIELYYHEEDGDIKDHIMYHTNEHPSKSKVYKLNNGFPYFKIGSFNLHQSGIDVTFENDTNCKDKYRASFLIRSYRVFTKNEEGKIYDLSIPFDKCSTHIFDDMFYEGISFDNENGTTIKWIELKSSKEKNTKQLPRKNVAWYRKNGDRFKKVTESDYKANEEKYNDDGYSKPVNYPQFFLYNGKSFLQDPKLWRFERKGIKEQ